MIHQTAEYGIITFITTRRYQGRTDGRMHACMHADQCIVEWYCLKNQKKMNAIHQ